MTAMSYMGGDLIVKEHLHIVKRTAHWQKDGCLAALTKSDLTC
jgi:hypothetical protein